MGKKIALGVGVAVAAVVAVIAQQPSSFAVERSLEIGAPAGRIASHIQNLRAMDAWSPWAKLDPELKIAYEGPGAGVGARSSWEGPEMGKGRLSVTAVVPDRDIEMRLEMLEPMAATNRIRFRLTPTPAGTLVSWRMEGERGFAAKALGLFVSMDDMVGGPFEDGLAALAAVAEAETRMASGG